MAKLKNAISANPSYIDPVDPRIEKYLIELSSSYDDPVLLKMEALAKKKEFPIVGRLVGISLEILARSIGARRVFEFGSGYGYSAFFFARAVGHEGEVICTDGKKENQKLAEEYLSQADLWDRIDFRIGMAQELFKPVSGFFDICYNDVDKGDYPEVWRIARERIRPGGLYIADNVLWHGRVALDKFEDVMPGWTEAIKEHNKMIFEDREFEAFINPIRDGVLVARKK